jgi:hypothetical protein
MSQKVTERAEEPISKAEYHVDKSIYDELVTEALEEDPVDFESALLPKEAEGGSTETDEPAGSLFQDRKFQIMGIAAGISLALNIFLQIGSVRGTEPKAADEELRTKFGPSYEVVKALDLFTYPKPSFSTPKDAEFIRSILSINESLNFLSKENEHQVNPEDFRFVGQEAVYIPPKN